MKNKLQLAAFLILLTTMIFAQDKFGDRLIQRNGNVIVCKVREIGDDEIKYVMEGYREDLVFGIDKNKVATISFADGREMKFSDSMYGSENYTDQRKNAFKFNFFSPLYGASAFSYERSLKPGRSFEVGLGLIGLGIKEQIVKDASGFHMNVGYKFIKDPDFYVKGMRYAHILKGGYVKPELAVSSYNFRHREYFYYEGENPDSEKMSALMGAFIINVGKQWIYSDRFLVDWYVGAGYGFGKNDSYNVYHYGFIGGDEDFPLVFKSGFKIGLLW